MTNISENSNDVHEMTIAELYNKLTAHNTEQTSLIREEIHTFVSKITETVEHLKTEVREIKNKNLLLERRVRKNNVIIFGVNLNTDNILKETLDTINHHLHTNLVESDINNIRLVGRGQRSLPIILEFVSFLKKVTIFKNIRNLKGTGIAISNDLCREDREQNRTLVKYYKKAKSEKIDASIKNGKLLVDGKSYTVSELKSLEDPEFISESEDGDSEQAAPTTAGSTPLELGPLLGGTGAKRKRRKILKSSPPRNPVTTRSRKQ